jgi:MFS family permease
MTRNRKYSGAEGFQKGDLMPEKIVALPEQRRWLMFAILLVGAFLPPLDFFIVNVALPSIQQSLGTASSAEQLIISSYAALYAVTLITGGRLGDIFGRMRMFFVGLIGFAVASLICGVAESPWVLIAGRSLQGVTAAVMAPQALASVQAIFPESEKPLALSLYGAVFGLASVVGQALGGILISLNLMNLGWRSIFLVNLPIALLVILIAIPVVKETRAPQTSKLDLGGTLLSMVTLAALIVPLIEGREAGWPWWAWLSLAAVPLLAWLFWRYEARLYQAQGAPLLNPAALRAPGLGRALLVALTFYAIGVFFLLFSIYLQGALHTSPLSAGLVFLPFGAGFLLGPLATHLFRRLLGSYVNPFGMALEVLGFVLLAWLVAHTPTAVTPSALSLAVILFPSDIDAHDHWTRGTGVFRHDCGHHQFHTANQHGTERSDHRWHFLHASGQGHGRGGHHPRLHRRHTVHRCVSGGRRRTESESGAPICCRAANGGHAAGRVNQPPA